MHFPSFPQRFPPFRRQIVVALRFSSLPIIEDLIKTPLFGAAFFYSNSINPKKALTPGKLSLFIPSGHVDLPVFGLQTTKEVLAASFANLFLNTHHMLQTRERLNWKERYFSYRLSKKSLSQHTFSLGEFVSDGILSKKELSQDILLFSPTGKAPTSDDTIVISFSFF